MASGSSLFRGVSSMEPLLPAGSAAELAELSAEVFRKSGELTAALPSKSVRSGVAALVREMNSYYSNLIDRKGPLAHRLSSQGGGRLVSPAIHRSSRARSAALT